MSREVYHSGGNADDDGDLYVEIEGGDRFLFWTVFDSNYCNVHMSPEDAWDFGKTIMEAAEGLLR